MSLSVTEHIILPANTSQAEKLLTKKKKRSIKPSLSDLILKDYYFTLLNSATEGFIFNYNSIAVSIRVEPLYC